MADTKQKIHFNKMENNLHPQAEYWIARLALQKHPEGGYFKETYRAQEIHTSDTPAQFPHNRNYATGIYFLLQRAEFSAFHKIKSDEMWHFYQGSTLLIYIISPEGNLSTIQLGQDPEKGETLQAVVPANHWFASEMKNKNGYALVGCTVAPGFDFQDFELANAKELTREYARHSGLIRRLCIAEK